MTQADILTAARNELTHGDAQLGERLLNEVLKVEPDNPEAWRLAADFAAERDSKIQYLSKVLELRQDDHEVQQQVAALAQAAASLGDGPPPTVDTPKPSRSPAPGQRKRLLWALTNTVLILVGIGAASVLLQLYASMNATLESKLREAREQVPTERDAETSAAQPTPAALTAGLDEGGFANIEPVPPPSSPEHSTTPDPVALQPTKVLPASPAIAVDAHSAEKRTRLPSQLASITLAAGGQLILLRLQGIPGVAVYDIQKKDIVKMIRFDHAKFVFGAGGNRLVVYFSDINVLQTWDLTTFEKLRTKPNPKGPQITGIMMGHSNGKQAVVTYSGGGYRNPRLRYILDVEALAEVPFPPETPITASSRSANGRGILRTDGTLQFVSELDYVTFLHWFDGASWNETNENIGVDALVVGDDGYLYSDTGLIVNRQLQTVAKIPGQKLIPGINGPFFVGVSADGTLRLYSSGETQSVADLGSFPTKNPDRFQKYFGSHPRPRIAFPFDQHILFYPGSGDLILLPFEHNEVIQQHIDLKSLLNEAEVDYLFFASVPQSDVKPGESWTYRPTVLSNHASLTFKLDFGPPGMKVSSNGECTWNVPEEHPAGREKAIVSVEGKSGTSVFQTIELFVERSKR